MPTILADTFTAALARLSGEEQKQAKLTVYDLQTKPDQPGLQFHRIDKSKDPNFWSVRVGRDVRIRPSRRPPALEAGQRCRSCLVPGAAIEHHQARCIQFPHPGQGAPDQPLKGAPA